MWWWSWWVGGDDGGGWCLPTSQSSFGWWGTAVIYKRKLNEYIYYDEYNAILGVVKNNYLSACGYKKIQSHFINFVI